MEKPKDEDDDDKHDNDSDCTLEDDEENSFLNQWADNDLKSKLQEDMKKYNKNKLITISVESSGFNGKNEVKIRINDKIV